MSTVTAFATWFVLSYFVLLNLSYLALNFLSLAALKRRAEEELLDDLPQAWSRLAPPISVIVPAYNEETTIAASVRSMLQLTYSEYEIIVLNDGSRDATLAVLKKEFELLPVNEPLSQPLQTAAVLSSWRSAIHPNLRVIDKANGGKADAINAGINAARYPLFCAVDADSILQRDSLQRIVRPFVNDPELAAAGGTVRIANGCDISGGYLKRVGLPSNLLALFQVVEYLRAFLFGRMGWSAIGGLLIISGAFGLFRKEVVLRVGGFRPKSIGEDMELVVRMHDVLRKAGEPCRIEFVPDPVCWTDAPEDWNTLRNQRIRWQRGLSESLSFNRSLLFSRHGGVPGWLAFPFFAMFEWLGPLVELGGYIFMAVAWVLGAISLQALFAFLFVAIGLGILLSVSGLLLEEMSFHLYPKRRHLLILLGVVVLENFGYRQVNSWWRLVGLWRWARNKENQWGVMTRKATWNQG